MKRRLDNDNLLKALLSERGVFVHLVDGGGMYVREERIVETEIITATRITLRNPSEVRTVVEPPSKIREKLKNK